MQDHSLFIDIIVILFSAFIIGLLLKQIGLNSILSFLISGVIIGPNGLSWIKGVEQIEIISEIGIILLMFILGMSFPPSKIKKLGMRVLSGGVLQVTVCVLLIMFLVPLMTKLFGFNMFLSKGFFLGSFISISSTAIVIKLLTDKNLVESLYGKIIVGYLIIQDLAAILFIALIPTLQNTEFSFAPIGMAFGKSAIFLIVILFLSSKIIPKVQEWIAIYGGKEIFFLGSICFCLGMAGLSYKLELSMALGAFLGGFALSESHFNYEIRENLLRFRDTFLCIFFVSMGMLINPSYLFKNPLPVLLTTFAIFFFKFIVIYIIASILHRPRWVALLVSGALFQIGEFGFVILKAGWNLELIDQNEYNLFLTSALLTMFFTPFVFNGVHKIFRKSIINQKNEKKIAIHQTGLKDHIIICGFGPIGQTLAQVLKSKDKTYVALEINYATVKKMQKINIPCYYGDATSQEILKNLSIQTAKMVVITVPDPISNEIIIKNIKELNPNCYILVRSRYNRLDDFNYNFDINLVVQEEFETGMAIIDAALTELGFSNKEIDNEIRILREERKKMVARETIERIKLSTNLSKKLILNNIESHNKEDVIKEMVNQVVNVLGQGVGENLYQSVMERESIESTGIGHGLAIPHARTDSVKTSLICIGIHKKGVEYQSLDKNKVHVIVMIISNDKNKGEYIKLLGKIVKIFTNTSLTNSLKNKNQNVENIIRLIKSTEDKLNKKT